MEHCPSVLMGFRDMRTHLGGQHPSERQGLYIWSLDFAVTAKGDEFNIHLFNIYYWAMHSLTAWAKHLSLIFFFIIESEKGENKDIEPNELGPRSLPLRICRPAVQTGYTRSLPMSSAN